MRNFRSGEAQKAFMELLWANEPLSSGELVKQCEKEFGWKKSTSYTVIHNMAEKGYVINEDGLVRSLIGKEQLETQESRDFVKEHFDGFLPAFVSAYTRENHLSEKERREILRIIQESEQTEP